MPARARQPGKLAEDCILDSDQRVLSALSTTRTFARYKNLGHSTFSRSNPFHDTGCRRRIPGAVDCRAAVWSNVRVNIKGRLLAIDYGEKNIGLAYSDALAITVQPLPSIPNTGIKELKRKLKSVAEELEITALVVGIPLNMDGSSNDSVRSIEKLMHQLESAIKLPMAGVDERLSTVEAEEYWGRMNARQKRKYRTIDSLAAALILERFLEEQ